LIASSIASAPGIAEEDAVGEAIRNEPLGEALLAGDAEEVRDVPELLALLDQRRDEMRVRVAEHGDRDAAGEIEIAATVRRRQIGAFAFFKDEIVPSISRQYGWNHGESPARDKEQAERTKRDLSSSSHRRRPPSLHLPAR